MTIQITLDDAEINAALNNLVRHINNLQPAMDDLGEALVGLIQEQLGRGETPWGDAFEPLQKPRKTQGRSWGEDIPLNDTRQHLFNRINAQSGSDYVKVGLLDNPHTPGLAIAHQFGSDRNGLPARPYLPIRNGQADLPQDWVNEVLRQIEAHLSL